MKIIYCDICGREILDEECGIIETKKFGFCRKNFPEVCKDCVAKIDDFITQLVVKF